MNAAVTATTDSIAPASALRTGTAARPWPESRARYAPAVKVTGAACRHRAKPGRPDGVAMPRGSGPRYDARRQAGHAACATSSPKTAIEPTSSTGMSALMPGSGSATRAVPTGISGDTATATPAAATAPTAAATLTSASLPPINWARVAPRAASAGLSAEPAASRRAATWPITKSAEAASTNAKRASATASGRMARSTAAACVFWSATSSSSCACVPGNWRASAAARRRKPSTVVPGRSFTAAPSATW